MYVCASLAPINYRILPIKSLHLITRIRHSDPRCQDYTSQELKIDGLLQSIKYIQKRILKTQEKFYLFTYF